MMSTVAVNTEEITIMIEMLPEQEQVFAYEFIKRLVLAWDPDFTKLTPAEAADMEEAVKEYEEAKAKGERFLTHEEVWGEKSKTKIA